MSLTDWRKRNGLTLAELGKEVGASAAALSRCERAERRPSPELAKRIEAATKGEVTAAELLGLNADKPVTRSVGESSRAFKAAPVSVAVPADLAEMACAYGLNVEALIAEGGISGLREAFKAAYIERHREAIDEINASVREHGTLSERFGTI